MKIVIDIPEITYKQLKLLTEQGFGTIIDEAVANGKPLEYINESKIFNDTLFLLYQQIDILCRTKNIYELDCMRKSTKKNIDRLYRMREKDFRKWWRGNE